ncbi:LmeA family phospholipid-binding protein [Auraticoccus monumenti]|uniref:DUF2993 domain-containing protein n=1 Tax=Auraticoccus monumenti TaxID=675864 RepID=A0A1G7D7J4_9ACTN|nr:DUF2993 domain-containing protein [Auraticoccus monumenti]SDE47487.1 Protein of unknown function [Auraticoccus monumenti]
MSRRSRRAVVALVVSALVLTLLGVGLVVGDDVGAETAEERARTSVQQGLGADVPPQLDIQGRPFLTQALRGDLERVVVHSDRTTLSTPRDSITVQRLDVVAEHVRSSDGFVTLTADRLSGSADVDYGEISRLAGRPIAPGEEGPAGTRWRVDVPTQVFGIEVPVSVDGLPVLDGAYGRQLVLSDVRLNVAGYEVPQVVADQVITTAVTPVPLDLPLGLGADSLRSTAQGMTVDFSGEDVLLS